jgi:hypothetical protein
MQSGGPSFEFGGESWSFTVYPNGDLEATSDYLLPFLQAENGKRSIIGQFCASK